MKTGSLIKCIFIAVILLSCNDDDYIPETYGSIYGRVSETDTTILLSSALVSTNPSTTAVYTDSLGIFRINNVSSGEYTVTASLDGYKTGTATITVNTNMTTDIDFLLKESSSDNTSPYFIDRFSPANDTVVNIDSVLLKWMGADDDDDDLYYDIIVYSKDDGTPIIEEYDLEDTSLLLTNLSYATNYFWQITINDEINNEVESSIRNFTTKNRPDNEYLYVSNTNGIFEIISSNDSGSKKYIPIDNQISKWSPVFSPNGKKFAYTQLYNSEMHIYTFTFSSGNIEKITSLPLEGKYNGGAGFSWSNDGNNILYAHNNKIVSVNVSSGTYSFIAQLEEDISIRDIIEVPESSGYIALLNGSEIYNNLIISLDNSGNITDTIVADSVGIISSPALSITGEDLLYSYDKSGYEATNGRQLDARIFTLNLQTREVTDLSNNKTEGTNDLNARFSPDGAHVIFTNSSNILNSIKDTYIMSLDGEDRTLLFSNATMPDWYK